MQNNVLMPGDKAGNYDKKWTQTFDLKFLILWIVLFAILLIVTIIFDPNLFSEKTFFTIAGIKLFVMMLIGFSLLFAICAIF